MALRGKIFNFKKSKDPYTVHKEQTQKRKFEIKF